MEHYKYLIVGGGMTADAAVNGIREADSSGSIGLISAEKHPPYNRPPLSKGLWKGEAADSIWRGTEKQNVALHLCRQVVSLDTARKAATDNEGSVYTFDKLMFATGAAPRRLPFDNGSIIYYRTLDDYERVRALVEPAGRAAVIGGGFIGWEMAAALAMNGKDVVMVFPEEAIGKNIYPLELARFLNEYYPAEGGEGSFRKHGRRIRAERRRPHAEDCEPWRVSGRRCSGRNWRDSQCGNGALAGPEG